MYKYQPITVDLSAFGDGLFARCLHPKLQPSGVFKRQKAMFAKAAAELPPELLQRLQTEEVKLDALPPDLVAKLAPHIASQMDVQDELLAALLMEWNLTCIYSGDLLPIPRAAQGADVLSRVPGEILEAIYTQIQAAMAEGPDPISASPSAR